MWNESAFSFSLPKDVGSGNSYTKSLEGGFKKYGVKGIEHISNPSCSLYASFGLTKGSVSQLFGLKNWIRGFEVTVVKGTPLGLRQIGDGFQMPGVFLISDGEIKDSYIHASASDRPDYNSIISCCAGELKPNYAQ